MKKWMLISLVLAGCAGTGQSGSGTGSGMGGSGGTGGSGGGVKPDGGEGVITVCHESRAADAVEYCLRVLPSQRREAVLATIRAWPIKKDIYFPYDLERESFRKRYSLDDDQVSCLVHETCGDENEDAL